MSSQHRMLQDILDQPSALAACLEKNRSAAIGLARSLAAAAYSKLFFVGCSTTAYIGLAAKAVFEHHARRSVEVCSASAFADYPPPKQHALVVAVSRSGETGDILAAVDAARRQGMGTLALVEVPNSTLTSKTDACLFTHAGEEGMVSIKSYTNGVAALCLLALRLAIEEANDGSHETLDALIGQLEQYPERLRETLEQVDTPLRAAVGSHARVDHLYFLGQGPNYATALEGALMSEEAALIHAHALPAGDLKHGHVNAVNEKSLVVALAPPGGGHATMIGSLQDAREAGAKVLVVGHQEDDCLVEIADQFIAMPVVGNEFLTPILWTVPMQLFAYHLAVCRGLDPDRGPGSERVGGHYTVAGRTVYSIRKR